LTPFNELDAILTGSGVQHLPSLFTQAETAEGLREWCRRSLASEHLVSVASYLTQRFDLDLRALEAMGVPVDILELFPEWRRGSRAGFRPYSLGLTPSPIGAMEPLGTLRLQLSPSSGTIPYAFALLKDLLRKLDQSVRFVVVVEPGANLDALRRLVRVFFHESAADRVRFAELRSITVFAQDNARAARDSQDRPVLLIPRAFARGSTREDDELRPEEAERVLGLRVVRSRLVWQGGNIVNDRHACLVGVDTIAENMVRFGLTAGETCSLLAADLGVEVTVLGNARRARFDPVKETMEPSGQAAFHIDLDVSLLGRVSQRAKPCALVADPVRGREHLSAVLARRSLVNGKFLPPRPLQKFIRAEYEAFARQRHPQLLDYARTLERLGYRVVGMPDLRIDPAQNVFASTNLDFSYCNVLPGLRRGRASVCYLPSGVPALDHAAEARFRSAGVRGVRIATPAVADALMRLQGALHCFSGPLE
jgi:hypothetical protein